MRKKRCYYFTIEDKEKKSCKHGFATEKHFLKMLDEQLSQGFRVLIRRTDKTCFDHCVIYEECIYGK